MHALTTLAAHLPHTGHTLCGHDVTGLLRDKAWREQEDVRDEDQVGRAPAGAGAACPEDLDCLEDHVSTSQSRRVELVSNLVMQ
jgi:hypothetical protein